ncbi:MAG TPA: DUF3089 domain-containing protein [Sphingomicrobium sp.]|nr:DUF3089 domain-containing protein [Sphingomicrobium sp.]
MYARRFLGLVLLVTLLVVAAAFAIFQWGGDILLKEAVPRGHFSAAPAGRGPDYRLGSTWISHPGDGGDPSAWLPEGYASTTSGNAAIFYIHPTTYLERDRWNAPLLVGGATELRTNLFVQSQASAFNAAGQIWAPRYRQAAYGAFLLNSRDAEAALDFAYGDVAAAFDEFVKQAGDRPIILAGHSQGALQLERLLQEKVANKPIARQIVAAYVVGWPVSRTSDLPSLGLPACVSPDQSRCILSWMTFGDPPSPDFIFHEWKKTRGLNGGERRREDTLCVNPISGTEDGAAQPQDNPGTLIPTADMRDALLGPGLVGARCDKGLLILSGMPPQLGPYVLPGNNYHVYDYALFWGAVRRDAERRLAAWKR